MQICIERGSPRCDTANQWIESSRGSRRRWRNVPSTLYICPCVRTCAFTTRRHAEKYAREKSYVHAYAPHASARGLVASGPHRPNKGALTPFRREAREKDRMVSYGMGRRTVGCGWINLNNLQQPLTFQEQFHFAVLDHSAAISCIPPHDSLFRPHASIFPTS